MPNIGVYWIWRILPISRKLLTASKPEPAPTHTISVSTAMAMPTKTIKNGTDQKDTNLVFALICAGVSGRKVPNISSLLIILACYYGGGCIGAKVGKTSDSSSVTPFTHFELRKQIAVALRARPLGLFLFFAIFWFRFFLGCLSELLFLFLLFLLLFLPERAGQFLHIRHGVLFVHDFCA